MISCSTVPADNCGTGMPVCLTDSQTTGTR
ncbi:Uncharacterised protein [Bordetella pertussis]|nr:Uncharacterised protein [Bordetella pertussis]